MKKDTILRGQAAFRHVLEAGVRFDGELLRCHACSEPGCGAAVRVGYGVSRRILKAVDRNRVRRLLREAFATERPGLLRHATHTGASVSLLFIYRPQKAVEARRLSLHDVQTDVHTLCLSIRSVV